MFKETWFSMTRFMLSVYTSTIGLSQALWRIAVCFKSVRKILDRFICIVQKQTVETWRKTRVNSLLESIIRDVNILEYKMLWCFDSVELLGVWGQYLRGVWRRCVWMQRYRNMLLIINAWLWWGWLTETLNLCCSVLTSCGEPAETHE